MRKKSIMAVLIAAAAVVFSAGCKQNVGTPEDNPVIEEDSEDTENVSGGRTIGYSCEDLSDPYCSVLKDSVKSSLERQGDNILVRDAQGDSQLQITQIDELIEEEVDAVFLCPGSQQDYTEALEKLKDAEIPVVSLEMQPEDDELIAAFVGSDESAAGKMCGEDLIERKPEGGKLVIAERQGDSVINERITGFEETVANKGFEVTRLDAGTDGSGITAGLNSLLSSGTVPDVIMCGDDTIALDVLEVLNNAGRTDVLVYSVGGSPDIKKALAQPSGPMAGVAAKSPVNIGKTAVETVTSILNGDKFEKVTYVETFFINRENLDIYGTDGWQ